MKGFIQKHRVSCALIIVLILWSASFIAWSGWVRHDPVDEHIVLVSGVSIGKEVDIRIPSVYTIELIFDRTGIPFKELEKLVGSASYFNGKLVPAGTIIPIRWSLRSLETGLVAASGSRETSSSSGHTSKGLYRSVGHFMVPAGKYIFELEVLRDVPEFKNVQTSLNVSLGGRGSSSWRDDLLFWGEIATFLITLPLILFLGLNLLFHVVANFMRQRKRKLHKQKIERVFHKNIK